MKKYNKNDIIELAPTDLCGNGNAVARDDEGFVFFVVDGVPGDVVKAKIIKVTKSYAVAIIDSFVKESDMRIKDGCKYSPKCGGCVFQSISYSDECEYKRRMIDDNLERIAGLDIRVSEFYPSRSTENYRNKAVYPVSTSKDGKMVSGFYHRNSHRICEHENCRIGNDVFTDVRDLVIDFCNRYKISSYDEETHTGLLRHIYIRSAADGTFVLSLILNGDTFKNNDAELKFTSELLAKFPQCVSVLVNVNKDKGNGVTGKKWRKVFGDGYLYDELLGKSFRIAPASFYQVNRCQAELLYSKAGELASIKPGETVLDLYCGTGTIGICLAKEGCSLYGVEIEPDAVTDAKYNAKVNNTNAEFLCLDTGEALNSERIKNISPNVIILDPPRKGCGPEAVERIASFGAERIVYISCDCSTMARDLKQFDSLGYTAQKVVGVDMFPRTGHVECCVLLCRENIIKLK